MAKVLALHGDDEEIFVGLAYLQELALDSHALVVAPRNSKERRALLQVRHGGEILRKLIHVKQLVSSQGEEGNVAVSIQIDFVEKVLDVFNELEALLQPSDCWASEQNLLLLLHNSLKQVKGCPCELVYLGRSSSFAADLVEALIHKVALLLEVADDQRGSDCRHGHSEEVPLVRQRQDDWREAGHQSVHHLNEPLLDLVAGEGQPAMVEEAKDLLHLCIEESQKSCREPLLVETTRHLQGVNQSDQALRLVPSAAPVVIKLPVSSALTLE